MTRKLNREFLSPKDVEIVYGLTSAMLAKARCRGTGPAFYRANRQIRYRRSDIEAWLGQPVRFTTKSDARNNA